MKLKLAIIFGALIWFLTYFLTNIFNPIFNNNLPYVNIMVPILIIIITGFFGILYILNINENEVVEGLYSAVSLADLQVANLTLEPIAAINIAIPEQFRLLNIALVDVGAGTSDISITKDGGIVAYGMIPHAGDEITESILSKCLVDFKTAEKIKVSSTKNKGVSFKDIMGISHKLMPGEISAMYEDTVNNMTKEIADKIVELNGGKSVSAVFVVGGGGKAVGFTEKLANYLSLPEERVALRGSEVLGDVDFLVQGVKKDPLLVTPIGICINFYNQKNNFIFVSILSRDKAVRRAGIKDIISKVPFV